MLNDGYAEHIVKGKTPTGVMAGMVLGAILIVAGVIAFFYTDAYINRSVGCDNRRRFIWSVHF